MVHSNAIARQSLNNHNDEHISVISNGLSSSARHAHPRPPDCGEAAAIIAAIAMQRKEIKRREKDNDDLSYRTDTTNEP
jgi:hypothetical protein